MVKAKKVKEIPSKIKEIKQIIPKSLEDQIKLDTELKEEDRLEQVLTLSDNSPVLKTDLTRLNSQTSNENSPNNQNNREQTNNTKISYQSGPRSSYSSANPNERQETYAYSSSVQNNSRPSVQTTIGVRELNDNSNKDPLQRSTQDPSREQYSDSNIGEENKNKRRGI